MGRSVRPLNRCSGGWFRGAAVCALLAALAAAAGAIAQVGPVAYDGRVTPAGEWLAQALDRLDVEHHWLRGHDHVSWRTGQPLLAAHGKQLTPLARDESHCSSFAAAAADSLGIYLLHPPEHSRVLLANAQFDWLASDAGRKAGWTVVATALEAQRRANRGELVVAAFKNPDATAAGHIAVVRPTAKAAEEILAKGPQITQAGFNNFRSADLASGFNRHPGAWERGRGAVQFYAHQVDEKKLAGEDERD
jgi:hypothetical protein